VLQPLVEIEGDFEEDLEIEDEVVGEEEEETEVVVEAEVEERRRKIGFPSPNLDAL